MKILITGGLGFLGKSLAHALLKDKNNEIIVFDNFQGGKLDHYTSGSTLIKGDVRDVSDWKKIPPVDYVYHFAAPSSIISFNEDPHGSVKTTIEGISNCIEWAIKNKTKKIIYPSSGSVYGHIQGVCSEHAQVNPLNLYGKTKRECELIAKKYEGKIPLLGLRIFAGFGPQEDQKGESASVIMLFLKKLLKKQAPLVYGDGMQTRDFIYIDDIVKVLISVLDDKTTGILNVGSGKGTSFKEVLACINTLLGSNILPIYAPLPDNYLLSTRADTTKLQQFLPRTISLEDGVARMLKC